MTDLKGRSLVAKFVHSALKSKEIDGAVRHNGFDAEDICLLYAGMIIPLLPKPCIRLGFPMLAATLPFMEPHRLEVILSQLSREITRWMSAGERQEAILAHAQAHAQVMWESHNAAKGESDVVVSGGVAEEFVGRVGIPGKQGEDAGSVTFDSAGKATMRGGKDADIVTGLAAIVIFSLRSWSRREDIRVLEAWFGIPRGKWGEKQYSEFGLGFVHWLQNCQCSSGRLPAVILNMAETIKDRTLPPIEKLPTPDVERVYEKLLGAE